MVCLATLAPAATAADATGFALLKRYLDGREPALPEGCVLDVELEAKELLARFLPAGRAAVEEAYRGMRAELGRRPTPTELLHAHYLPHTLRAAHGSWFGFCRAEGDLDASEERVVERSGRALVEQNLHAEAWSSRLAAANSSTASTCSRVTPGNHSTN
jgi:hypothetical protein